MPGILSSIKEHLASNMMGILDSPKGYTRWPTAQGLLSMMRGESSPLTAGEMNDVAGRTLDFVTPLGGFLGTFAGVGAKTANLGKLALAKRYHDAGLGKGDIFSETGWFLGKDGKWRFEINDDVALLHNPSPRVEDVEQLKRAEDALMMKDVKSFYPEGTSSREAFVKTFGREPMDGSIALSRWPLGDLQKHKYAVEDKIKYRGEGRLEEVMDHPELFKAYPELRDLIVERQKFLPKGHAGISYGGTIGIADNPNLAQRTKTGIHEIQHEIDRLERGDYGYLEKPFNRSRWETNSGENLAVAAERRWRSDKVLHPEEDMMNPYLQQWVTPLRGIVER